MKYFFIFILLTISMYSSSLKMSIIGDISMSTDGKTFKSIFDIIDFNNKKFTAKIILNTEILEDEKFYLKIHIPKKYLASSNLKYDLVDNFPIFELSKGVSKELLISADYKNETPSFLLSIYGEFDYKYLMPREKLLFGISYGIILCALLYNFAFFYFNRKKSFLYYSCLQLSSIVMLSIIAMPFTFIHKLYPDIDIFNFIVDIVIVFSILFSIEFLNSKKLVPTMHKILLFMLIITLIDLIVLIFKEEITLYTIVPTFVPIGLLIITAIFSVIKGNKSALFYLLGWLVLFICVLIVDIKYVDINEIYLLHFAFPTEALIFSCALGYKMRLMDMEKQKSEQLLVHQSKLASMGGMIANIAHQWRQPLTHLSYVNMNLKVAYEQDKLTPSYFNKKTNEINSQIEFMSNTINDFRNFFKVDKKIENFDVYDCFKTTYNLLDATLKHHNIEIEIKSDKDVFINSYKNELAQVIFNILNNAKEEFINKNIKDPKINVEICESKKEILLIISDNASGIDKNIVDKIFEPYFTTKKNGMGIGLYMSKVIIEQHMKGKLEVKNILDGVLFKIHLPKL